MGGGARYSLSALPGNSRIIVRHRLQVGAARASDARKTNRMCEVIGIDGLNQCATGWVAMTLTGNRVDNHSVPCVLIVGNDYELSESDRAIDVSLREL